MAKVIDVQTDQNIHKGRRAKLREQYIKVGMDGFTEHAVLEFGLGFVFKQMDTNPIAHRIIDKYGSVYNAANANPEDLKKIPGMGEQSAFFLSYLGSFAKYYNNSSVKNIKKITNTQQAINLLLPVASCLDKEHFYIVCLGADSKVLYFDKLFMGNATSVGVNIASIMEIALRFSSTAVIVAHNHPQASAKPSAEDIVLTNQLVNALSSVNIDLLDHIIIGQNKEVYSCCTSLLLDNLKSQYVRDNIDRINNLNKK